MNEFIKNYPEMKQNEINEQKRIKELIVGLLMHISENDRSPMRGEMGVYI